MRKRRLLKGYSVLVLSKHWFEQEVLEEFRRAGAVVRDPVGDARTAVEMVRRKRTDCAVIDMDEFGHNIAAAKALREEGVALVVISDVPPPVTMLGENSGVWLKRPVGAEAVVAAVAQALSPARRRSGSG